jgi:hypothetical protein
MGPFIYCFFSIFICLSAYWGFGSVYCLPFFVWSLTLVLFLLLLPIGFHFSVVPYIGFGFAYCIPFFSGPLSFTLKCLIYISVGPQTFCAV